MAKNSQGGSRASMNSSIMIPQLNKMMYSSDLFVERSMPIDGDLVVKIGTKVEPVTRLGMTKVSYGVMHIGKKLKLSKGKLDDGYFYKDEKIGSISSKSVIAPFNGYLVNDPEKGYMLKQEDRDYWLLAGVWGTIVSYVENKSVLISTQALDIPLVLSTGENTSGELIVFPNPAQFLAIPYLEEFAGDIMGKIIYVGDSASLDLINRAAELGAGGIVTGSVDKATFVAAKRRGLFLGVISGFGSIPTPPFVFDLLKEVSNRYVFLLGERRLLRIPVPSNKKSKKQPTDAAILQSVTEGMLVQIFEKPYFGWIGKIDSVQGEDVYVKLDGVEQVFKTRIPNIIAVTYDTI